MGTIYRDFVSGTLSASIGNSDSSISSAGFAALPVLSGSDVAKIVLDPFGEDGAPEIVYVTGHTASATTVTGCLRGQDASTGGGAARAHASGMLWIHAPVASDWVGLGTNVSAVINDPGNTLATGAPASLDVGGGAVTGSSPSISRADHRHALAAGSPVASAPGDVLDAGASTAAARADHKHQREAFAAPVPVGATAAPGTAPSIPRSDHVHILGPGAISAASQFGGATRAHLLGTSTSLPAGMPVGTTVWATDKKRLYVLQSTGPDVWTYDMHQPLTVASSTKSLAPTGGTGEAVLNGFTVVEAGEVTVNTNGLVLTSAGLWEIGGQGIFSSVSGTTSMFRLFSVQINGSEADGLTASGDAQGSLTAGFGYSPGSVQRPMRLAAGTAIGMHIRHNYTTALTCTGKLWARRLAD